jgi:hypothetical protein
MFPEPIVSELAAAVAALSEGQRAIAHLVVLLVLAVAAGLVFVIRRVRRSEETEEQQPIPEEER